MIEFKNVNFSYEEEKVLNSISFKIEKGEKVALLGSNGSGKSTILRILAGLYFTKGYLFEKKEVTKKIIDKNFRKKVSILFQNPESMIFNPSVYDEIVFSLKEFDIKIENQVEQISDKFGITSLLKKTPLNLSGGEKQKIVLASLLIYEPELILLDEPTTAMDPRTTGWFIDLMIELEKTIILATHDLSVAYEICDRAIVLNENHKIVFDGDIETLFKNRELLLEANLIYTHKHKRKKFINSAYHLHF